MTLKYPKKSVATKRKGKLHTELPIQYPESWANVHQQQQQHHQHQHQQHHNGYPAIAEYTTQYTPETAQYSPDYSYASYTSTTVERAINKSPLLAQDSHHQLSPALPLTNHHLMESCDWSTNHETAAKPVAMTYTSNSSNHQDENNNSNNGHQTTATHWASEFTYIDAKAEQQLCSPNNGGSLHQPPSTELMPEFINFFEHDQQTGFPPSISSNASTLSSPTTSSDYNFNYQFDTLNSSMSNDGCDVVYQQPHMIDTYPAYETMPMETANGIYATDGVYSTTGSSEAHWTADISNIPYEPNYYPFANCTEKMMIY